MVTVRSPSRVAADHNVVFVAARQSESRQVADDAKDVRAWEKEGGEGSACRKTLPLTEEAAERTHEGWG